MAVTAAGALLLGVRLSLAKNGRSRARVALAGLGVTFAVVLLVAGLAVAPVAAARAALLDARTPAAAKDKAATADGVLAAVWDDRYLSHEIAVHQVAVVGRAPAPPTGLRSYPGPGEMTVSPALRAMLSDPAHRTLRERYPDRVVATIAEDGLLGPGELAAWIGVPRTAFPRDERVVAGFGGSRRVSGLPAEVRVALPFGVAALLVPLLVLVATAARIGAAERDQRLAALRLLGVTPVHARLVAAAEAMVAAASGVVAGIVAFALARGILASRVPVRGGVWAADAAPPVLLVVFVALAIPALSVLAAVVAQRSVVLSPLGASRRVRQSELHAVRLVPLLLGLALLVAAYVDRTAVRKGQGRAVALLVCGAVLVLLGLAVATPLVAQLTARLTASRARGIAALLAARRVEADPHSVARLVTGVTLLIFVSGWVLSMLPLLAPHGEGTARQLAGELREHVFVTAMYDSATVERARAVPGVAGVAPLYQVTLAVRPDEDLTVTATDCVGFNAVLREPLPACGDGTVYLRDDAPDLGPGRMSVVQYESDGGETTPRRQVGTLVIASQPVRTERLARLGALNLGAGLVPLAATPRAALDTKGAAQILVATDGNPLTMERVRTALMTGAARARSALAIEDIVATEEAAPRRFRRIALFGLLAAALVAASSLAVALIDGVSAQRRSLAALVAAGTPVRVLRRAVLAQTALSLLPSVALALLSSAAASALYLGMDDDAAVSLPWLQLLGVGTGCAAVVLLASAATLPALRQAVHPRELRVE